MNAPTVRKEIVSFQISVDDIDIIIERHVDERGNDLYRLTGWVEATSFTAHAVTMQQAEQRAMGLGDALRQLTRARRHAEHLERQVGVLVDGWREDDRQATARKEVPA